jgi:cathepsin L
MKAFACLLVTSLLASALAAPSSSSDDVFRGLLHDAVDAAEAKASSAAHEMQAELQKAIDEIKASTGEVESKLAIVIDAIREAASLKEEEISMKLDILNECRSMLSPEFATLLSMREENQAMTPSQIALLKNHVSHQGLIQELIALKMKISSPMSPVQKLLQEYLQQPGPASSHEAILLHRKLTEASTLEQIIELLEKEQHSPISPIHQMLVNNHQDDSSSNHGPLIAHEKSQSSTLEQLIKLLKKENMSPMSPEKQLLQYILQQGPSHGPLAWHERNSQPSSLEVLVQWLKNEKMSPLTPEQQLMNYLRQSESTANHELLAFLETRNQPSTLEELIQLWKKENMSPLNPEQQMLHNRQQDDSSLSHGPLAAHEKKSQPSTLEELIQLWKNENVNPMSPAQQILHNLRQGSSINHGPLAVHDERSKPSAWEELMQILEKENLSPLSPKQQKIHNQRQSGPSMDHGPLAVHEERSQPTLLQELMRLRMMSAIINGPQPKPVTSTTPIAPLTPEQMFLLKHLRSPAGLLEELVQFKEDMKSKMSPELDILERRQQSSSLSPALLRLLTNRRSQTSTVEELLELKKKMLKPPTTEQRILEYLLERSSINLRQIYRLAYIRAARSNRSLLQEIITIVEQLHLRVNPLYTVLSALGQRNDMSPEEKLMAERRRTEKSALQQLLGIKQDAMTPLSPEQQLLQQLHQQNAPMTPMQKLLLDQHSQSSSIIPEIALMEKFPSVVLLTISANNVEAALYESLATQNRELTVDEMIFIQHHFNAVNERMRRIRFLLALRLSGYVMPPMTPQEMHKQEMIAHMIKSMRESDSQEWNVEVEMLLKRYRDGDASLMKTIADYRRLDMRMNSRPAMDIMGMMMKMQMLNNSSIRNRLPTPYEDDTQSVRTDTMDELWEMFKIRYARQFSPEEEKMRRPIFEAAMETIMLHNIEADMKNNTFRLGMNDLSDKTEAELAKLRGYRTPKASSSSSGRVKRQSPTGNTYTNTVDVTTLPATVNWTAAGWVGPVLNQGQCGSCWAFSAAGALEAQYYNKTKTYVQLSEQNLVDCTAYLGNYECGGGAYQYAFEYVMDVGIDSLVSYPYTGLNGTCAYVASESVTTDNGWYDVETDNELALQQAVALTGPVSVAVDASHESFQLYSSGVYAPTYCSASNLDHAVLAVGYGTTSSGQDYWLLKNSWGTSWGINGYMMMERNVNMCGIAMDAGFPVIN